MIDKSTKTFPSSVSYKYKGWAMSSHVVAKAVETLPVCAAGVEHSPVVTVLLGGKGPRKKTYNLFTIHKLTLPPLGRNQGRQGVVLWECVLRMIAYAVAGAGAVMEVVVMGITRHFPFILSHYLKCCLIDHGKKMGLVVSSH